MEKIIVSAIRAYQAMKEMINGGLKAFDEKVTIEQRLNDLREWNIIQFKLFTKFCEYFAEGHEEDANLFGKFGVWFFEYVENFEDYPTIEDLPRTL